MPPVYLTAWASGIFQKQLDGILRLFSPCRLCPRRCHARRMEGEAGACGQKSLPRVARALPHFGEEPPLTGSGGAGAVFFSGCALHCVYCQNHQISQGNEGQAIQVSALAGLFLDMQTQGCHNLDLVSPTPHLPFILQALAVAIPQGLRIPMVYNTHGYLLPEVLDLLDGIVDIYLPDMKYGSEDAAESLSMAPGYVSINREAVKRMYHQTGPLRTDTKGTAQRGILVRHLVLPGDAARTKTVLQTLSRISTRIPISLMAQYRPCHRTMTHPFLSRPITGEEYEKALESAQDLGFETLFSQDLESSDLYFPDFSLEDPFSISKPVRLT